MNEKNQPTELGYDDYIRYSYEDLIGLKTLYEQRILEAQEDSILTKLSKKFNKDFENILITISKIYIIVVILVVLGISGYVWINQLLTPDKAMEQFPLIMKILLILMGLMIPFALIDGILNNHRPKGLYRKLMIINRVIESKQKLGDGNINPEKPFSNKMKYLECFSQCFSEIKWLDKYLNTEGVKILHEALKNNKSIREIKLLTSISGLGEDNNLRDNFKVFKKEWEKENIKIEMRILNSEDSSKIHDRFLISKNLAYNFISPDVMKRGQLSTISKIDPKSVDFDTYWNNGKDIIKDWGEILPKK